jgi:RNA polymerase sigma factor (sigma-70 family)
MSDTPHTRGSLILRLAGGRDSRAWDQFVEIYAPLVFQLACRRGLQDADAADITQEVLVNVSRAMAHGKYRAGEGTFRGWLLTIARNEIHSLLAARQRREQAGGGTTAQLQLAALPAPEETAAWDRDYEQRLFAWAAQRVQAEVQPATWRAFQRTALDRTSGEAVAAELGMTLAAVYLAKSRVMKRLREAVREVEDEGSGFGVQGSVLGSQ